MHNIVFLQNQINNFYWGDNYTLSEFCNVPNEKLARQAELCMGANAQCGSFVQKGRKFLSLAEIVQKDPQAVLGTENALKFNNNLPFLLRVIVADTPLPVQVNPNGEQAFVGYARENLLKIALNDPARNYLDANERPELVYALKPFWLMCGFRELDAIKANLAVLIPRFFIEQNLGHADIKTIFNVLIQLNADVKALVINKALANAAKLNDANITRWIIELAKTHANDIGVLMPAILNVVELKAGTALFIAPGVTYCYLKGFILSLSGNSLSALRCALTTIPVDLAEFNLVNDFTSHQPVVIAPKASNALETSFAPPETAFSLSVINMPLSGQIYNQKQAVPQIIFCAEGKFVVTRHGLKTGLTLSRGQSMFISHGVGGYGIKGQGLIYKAAVS